MSNRSKFENKLVPNILLTNKISNRNSAKHNINVISRNLSNSPKVDKQSNANTEDNSTEICLSDTENLKCVICDEDFLDKFNLRKHITQSHPEISDLIFCDTCNESFLTKDELNYHISVEHNTTKSIAETSESSTGNAVNKPKKLKQRRLYYLKKYLQMTNQLFGKYDNGSVMRKTQRRTARRQWVRKQMELSRSADSYSQNKSKSEDDTTDMDKNNLQYPTSTVEIEECPIKIEEPDKVGNDVEPLANDESRNDTLQQFQVKLELSNDALAETLLADSSVSNQLISDDNEESIIEMRDNLSVQMKRIKSDLEFIEISNEDAEETINDDIDWSIKKNSLSFINKSKESSCASDNSLNKSIIISSTLSAELKRKPRIIDDKIVGVTPTKKPTTCRTYSDKTFLQTIQKQVSNLKNNKLKNRIYCHMCNEIFSLMEQKCMKITEGNKEYIKCLFCNYKFMVRASLEKHVAFSHLNCECIKNIKPVKNFLITDKDFGQQQDASNCANYECSICSKTFVNYDKFNYHILNAHDIITPLRERLTIGKPEYLRRLSPTYFLCKPAYGNENSTIKKVVSNKIIPMKCVTCELVFLSCGDYIRHIKQYHTDLKPILESSWYPLQATNTETINTTLRLLHDLKGKPSVTDISEKNFFELRKTCKRCNREFDSIRDLSKHFYLVHDDGNVQNQTMIMPPVTGERRTHDWYCLHCSQRFKLLQSYIRHRYFVHDDESMIHICDNCCKILTSIEMVNVHVCLNVTSWTCKQCNESFPTGIALRLHNTEKHFEVPGPYVCSTCEKKFLTKAMLLRHIQTINCYSHVPPPKRSETTETVVILPVKIDRLISQTSDPGNDDVNAAENKQSNELLSIANFTNVEVLQEDVLLRESVEKNSPKNNSKTNKSDDKEDDKIYQCSMCKLYFLSKTGLKLHINRAHTSAVEICQLCYRMYDTGNLVRHIIDKHLRCDVKNSDIKINDKPEIKAIDIEKDTEELIEILGTKNLLALCEYQRHLELNFNHIACPRCSSAFETSEQYRLHSAQMHDKLCALCNLQFESGPKAADHKSTVHGSIPCYVWFAHKLILAIGDTKTFEETAEKIIIETMTGISGVYNNSPMVNDADDDNNTIVEEVVLTASIDDGDDSIDNDYYEEEEPKHDEQQQMILTINPDVSVEPSEEDDELRMFLVVTEQDLDMYKNNLTQLAENISSACNIFSTEDVEKLLQMYVKENDN